VIDTYTCHKCNSTNHEKRNIKTTKDENDTIEVEFSLYCKDCGSYLVTFYWGHWEY